MFQEDKDKKEFARKFTEQCEIFEASPGSGEPGKKVSDILSRTQISNYKRGISFPSVEIANKLAGNGFDIYKCLFKDEG